MKKLRCLILVLICLISLLAGFAHADGGTWYCSVCNTYRSTEWCPDCGSHRPDDTADQEWPTMTLNGVGTSLRALNDESKRHQSFFGPNKNYPGAGAYKPYKVTSATALFCEGDYVFVDMSYQTVGRRCVYFKASSLTNANAQYVSLTAYPAVTTVRVQPHFGPGYEYDSVIKKNGNSNEDIILNTGTRINVFFETDDWLFTEFSCALGTVRAWLPSNTVQ